MIKNFFKVTFRSLWKNKSFVFINVFGMGIALACCIVAYLNWDFNYRMDEDEEHYDKLYRVNFVREFQGRTTKYGIAPLPMGEAIRQNIPELDAVIRYIPSGGNVKIKDDLFNTNISYTDPEFLDNFTFELLSGSKEDLKDKSKIFISDDLAKKYFGDEDPVGKQITRIAAKVEKEYLIAGVFRKKPQNSSFSFVEALTNFENYIDENPDIDINGWEFWSTVIIRLEDPTRKEAITRQLQDFVKPQNEAREDFKLTRYYLDPLEGFSVRAEREDLYGHWFRDSMPTPAVVAPGIMAILILLIACFNFTNTSIAISSRRLKEIGLRKVMGGLRKQLVAQFLGENVILCLLALGVGLLIAEFLVPAYSQMWEFISLDLSYTEDLNFILFLVGLLIFTGLLAGSYPAFYVSKFEPTAILKGTLKFGGTNFFTRTLLTLQYSISLLAIISGVAFVQNAKYQQEFDYGYDVKSVIYSRVNDFGEYETYKNALEDNPDIDIIGGSEYQLFSSYRNDPIRHEETEIETDILHVGEGYLEAMGIELLEGRFFKENSETDRKESVLVSEYFVQEFGWDEALGKRIVWMDTVQLYVIGVVKDIYSGALWNPLDPMMIRYTDEENYRYVVVKTDAEKLTEVNEYMESKWEEIFPNRLYNGQYLERNLAEAAEVNNNILKLFLFLGIVAAILSASGLFTMVSLNIIKKMKEIGVRKVLGASISNIAGKLNKEFFIILLIASVLGSVIGTFLVKSLMDSIWVYHMEMNVIVLILSILLLFFISGITIGYKVYHAASMNPALTLRDE